MKTKEQISRYRDNLRYVIAHQKCNCAKTGHVMECVAGAAAMAATVDALSWLLGENEGLEAFVQHFEDFVQHEKAARN